MHSAQTPPPLGSGCDALLLGVVHTVWPRDGITRYHVWMLRDPGNVTWTRHWNDKNIAKIHAGTGSSRDRVGNFTCILINRRNLRRLFAYTYSNVCDVVIFPLQLRTFWYFDYNSQISWPFRFLTRSKCLDRLIPPYNVTKAINLYRNNSPRCRHTP